MGITANGTIRVVIIDDQEVVRIGVRAALENDGQIEIVGEGMTPAEALQLTRQHQPDVVLLGLNTITGEKSSSVILSACDTIRGLVQTCQTNILVLGRYAHKVLVRALIHAGASGFMLKDEAMNSCATLAQAIVDIARKRKLLLSPTLYEKLYPDSLAMEETPLLTGRRIAYMQAIADNPHLTIAQVADLLGIAESTLRNNLSTVFRALDTPGLNGALVECLRMGLVQINNY
ncbi:MAG: response regulator transcription factor [Anaerolineae bacterium]|nr:response regulator transcription factor [Anaerolineae bacterium]